MNKKSIFPLQPGGFDSPKSTLPTSRSGSVVSPAPVLLVELASGTAPLELPAPLVVVVAAVVALDDTETTPEEFLSLLSTANDDAEGSGPPQAAASPIAPRAAVDPRTSPVYPGPGESAPRENVTFVHIQMCSQRCSPAHHHDASDFQYPTALAIGRYGQIYAGGVGAGGYPALAFIAP